MDDSTRRHFVRATALTSIGLLAGCSDGGGGGAVGTDEDDGADDDGADDGEAETETPEGGQEETEADMSFSPRAGDA
ncbi:copper-binding protein [Halomicrobium sp. HM KBTZ05]|uniref:Copper-binding protein n=1 Tax=Halomicrobium mukohataei TaxID=57705 RepID=A0A847U7W9_9EURY|nr:copper-binding protein [Halomicrobium mukohataei]NLV09069.1 copper-binding protein [Halomicrobium mukohataei]